MEAFDVFLNGRCVDTVFFTRNAGQTNQDTVDEVRLSLVNHDGYNPGIEVRLRRPTGQRRGWSATSKP
jgi:hypothetical protein